MTFVRDDPGDVDVEVCLNHTSPGSSRRPTIDECIAALDRRVTVITTFLRQVDERGLWDQLLSPHPECDDALDPEHGDRE